MHAFAGTVPAMQMAILVNDQLYSPFHETYMPVSDETIAGIPVQFRWNWRYADAGFTDAEHQIVCGLSSEQLGIEELRKIVYSMFT